MTSARPVVTAGRGTLLTGTALLGVTAAAWVLVLRDTQHAGMAMPGMSLSPGEAVAFTAAWGVMMTAMMLPSAAPMILLYRTVSGRLAGKGERAIPTALFAAIYLAVWLLFGVPVYGASVALESLVAYQPATSALLPYGVAIALVAAGGYQLTEAKGACLRRCRSPLDLLMERWRSGYAATSRLALSHAAYCIGCCWALMLILVAAGAMSLPWVLLIAALVFVEKVLPFGEHTARVTGGVLILLGIAVALQPELVATLRGTSTGAMPGMGQGASLVVGVPDAS